MKQAAQRMYNAYNDFQQIRDTQRDRGRAAEISAATFSINERTRGLGESDMLNRLQTVGGAQNTINARARFGAAAARRQQHIASRTTQRQQSSGTM